MLRRLNQRTAKFGSGVTRAGVGATGALEHCGELTKVGRHRHQPIDTIGERGHSRLALERHTARDRFQQREAQRIDIALGLHRQTSSFLRRAVLRPIHAARRHVTSGVVQHLRQTNVDDPQPSVIAKDQRRRADIGVHQASAVHRIERLARIESNDQRLRRREQSATVKEVAQAAANQSLGCDVQHFAVVPGSATRVVDGGNVGMLHTGSNHHYLLEPTLELGHRAEIGVYQLEDDRALQLLVVRVEDCCLKAAAQSRAEPVAPGDRPRRKGRFVGHHDDRRT